MFQMEIGCWEKWDQLLSEVDSSAELCEVRQVMQSGNCVPARRLKLYWWIVNIIKPFFTKPILNNQLEHDSLSCFVMVLPNNYFIHLRHNY